MERMVAVNGFSVRAVYREESVRERFLPALHLWSRLAQEKGEAARLVVYLCAPPGAGKSTLAAYLEALSRETEGLVPLQALGMDGFHYKNSEMADKTVLRGGKLCPMKDFKGGPESFDVLKLEKALQRLGRGEKMRWPLYDRTLHDVVEDAIEVTGRIALVEGNWLLYRQMPWPRIHGLCDISISLPAAEALLRPRLIERKLRGGLTMGEAEAFYERSDGLNVRLWHTNSLPAQTIWPLPL